MGVPVGEASLSSESRAASNGHGSAAVPADGLPQPGPPSDWDEGKLQHKELANKAAPLLDRYGTANFSTGLYMAFEEKTLKDAIGRAPDHEIALDIGCGTGRHSFILAKHFEQVRGYDFAEKMIEEADKKKLAGGFGTVAFSVRDIERDLLPEKDNSVSLVVASFGMGSFVNQLPGLLREIRRVLKRQGVLVISFYNSESLIVRLKDELLWGPSLAARYDSKTRRLEVSFAAMHYNISAKPYGTPELKRILDGYFAIDQLMTFPTLSALLPNDLFKKEDAKRLCETVDKILALNHDIAGGPYILAVCHKEGRAISTPEPVGYERVLRILRTHGIRVNERDHAPTSTLEELESALAAPRSSIVKTVLFVQDGPDSESRPQKVYGIVMTADRKANEHELGKLLQLKREQLRMARQREVEDVAGFQIPNLPPFGFPKSVTILLDASLQGKASLWCSLGKNTQHAALGLEDLRTLTACTRLYDLSKPEHRDANA